MRSYSARDAVGAVALVAAAAGPVLRRLDPRRRPRRSIPGSAATSSRRRRADRAGSPTGCRSTRPSTSSPAGSRPISELGGGGFDEAAAATAGAARVPAGHPRRLRPGRDRRRRRRRRSELETLLVTGDSLSTPLDTELARRLAPDGVEVIRDPHLGTGISNSRPGRLGRALDRPGGRRRARRGGRLHRRQRGLRDARARRRGGRVLRRPSTPRSTPTGCAR